MIGRIRVLDEHTANQIAAGEVVERPASVVKELVENSIDAGSTAIEVEIREGGLDYIRVSDNGEGMEEADAVLAFQRHATSKIATPQDLYHINSLGFRGEALPSIAAIAKVELVTRPRDKVAGMEVVIHGGQVVSTGEVGCPAGTRLVVKDLFFNTPARRKFLKSGVTEGGHIGDIITRLALANPGIAFKFINNSRVAVATPGTGQLMDVIISIYGKELAKQMLPLRVEVNGSVISGYIAKPEVSRSNRSYQTLFINGRYIRSQAISGAVTEGYHTMLEIGRHPVFILGLEMETAKVDVNVHPTKMEVRLEEEAEIRESLAKGVAETLRGQTLIPAITLEKPAAPVEKEVYRQESLELSRPRAEKSYAPQEFSNHSRGIMVAETFLAETPPVKIQPIESAISYETQPTADWQQPPTVKNSPVEKVSPSELVTHEERFIPIGGVTPVGDVTLMEQTISPPPVNPLEYLIPLGQVNSSYIVATGEDGLYIIDQHAAHERILYEEFMMAASQEEPPVQQLLIPITLELTHLEAQVVVDYILLFSRLGFILEHFGGDSFLIRAVPQGLTKGDEKQFFLDLLDKVAESGGKWNAALLKEHLITTMACKAAIKANDHLAQALQEELLRQLARTANPYTCPHGRPTITQLTLTELEKKFKRA
ncbi:MAG: DNA mismatch repair endonuclease MutL [Clostridia bacterium]|nr:DNA mismatch repair endonuclease MutL [Clostridia bacterium]